MIEEVRDRSFTDRSDYNNSTDELGLIKVSDREARDSNAIIRELESVGLEFRKKRIFFMKLMRRMTCRL